MSHKNSQMIPYQSLSVQTPFRVSPAKARKLEHVMRGSNIVQHGITQIGHTQIGFGNDAVDVNDLFPMDIDQNINKSISEHKDIDEYTTVNQMTMRNRRRSSSQFLHDMSSNDSLSGRKRRQNEVSLTSFNNYPNKRHCNSEHNSRMMLIDENSQYINDMNNNNTNNNNSNNNSNNNELFELKNNNKQMRDLLELRSKEIESKRLENVNLLTKLQESEVELNKQIELHSNYEIEMNLNKDRNSRAVGSLKLLLNEIAISERQERETKLNEDNKMLGRVIQCQTNNFGQINDIWEDGKLFEDLKRRKKILEKQKLEIENKKKELRKLKTKNNKNNIKKNTDGFAIPQNKNKINKLLLDLEIISIRLSAIKKQIQELEIEYQSLEYRKKLHIKFIRLMREEKRSRFSLNSLKSECYVINARYVLINLLGRGGFSEVHRGYDLIEHKYIAAKIHQLNTQWSDERKRNYTKHATREYDIHKSLNHENIVSLYDVFGIDVNSFCTVLEYCDGMDLDMYLKINKPNLSEKESKLLIIQIFKGLKYLHNTKPSTIIHYDLKPGNLLYKNGKIKLTDFGLAKIMENSDDSSNNEIELTSQGAGTYWYLPPECFRSFGNNNNCNNINNQPIMISPKVDIWSAGVIFYQMLFGKRPFGHNLSQDSILNNKTILNAHNVIFPNQPKNVSKQAKDFIAQCCAYDPKLRLSSNQIVDNHPYFAFLRK